MNTRVSTRISSLLAAGLIAAAGSAALAQDTKAKPAETKPVQPGQPGKPADKPMDKPSEAKPAPEHRPAPAPLADPELEKITSMLVGTWQTTAPVAQVGGEAGAKTDVVANVARVNIDGVPGALYLELARADASWQPYRQSILQVYRYKGKPRFRTYEFHKAHGIEQALVGLWLVPDLFPALTREDLIGTLDIDLAAKGKGYAGKTPYAFPTGKGGAVEMTSEIDIQPDQVTTSDQGIGPDGKVVWGQEGSAKYTFAKHATNVKMTRGDDGLVLIDFVHPAGEEIKQGDKVSVQYSGWLPDGTKFDSSRDPGREPFTYDYPGNLIKGWNDGSAGLTKGTIRRMVIPPGSAYGERGVRGKIPPSSTLYFEIEVLAIQHPEPAAAPQPADGGGAPEIKKLDPANMPKAPQVKPNPEAPKPEAPKDAPKPK
jgi:hypothetical protein